MAGYLGYGAQDPSYYSTYSTHAYHSTSNVYGASTIDVVNGGNRIGTSAAQYVVGNHGAPSAYTLQPPSHGPRSAAPAQHLIAQDGGAAAAAQHPPYKGAGYYLIN